MSNDKKFDFRVGDKVELRDKTKSSIKCIDTSLFIDTDVYSRDLNGFIWDSADIRPSDIVRNYSQEQREHNIIVNRRQNKHVYILLRFEEGKDTRIIEVFADREGAEKRKKQEEGRKRFSVKVQGCLHGYTDLKFSFGIVSKNIKGKKK